MDIETNKVRHHEPDPEDVLTMMRTAGVQLTPENYHVWFEYARGQNGQLVSQVERIREAGKAFTKEINKKLYTEFFNGDDDHHARRLAQKRTHAILREALNGILTSQASTSEYQDSLSDFTNAMTNLTDTQGIAGLVKELVRESNRMAESSIYYQNQLEDVRAEAMKLNDALEEAMHSSSIDPLTGLFNRKAVDEKLQELLAAYRTENTIFTVVMIDVDKFRDFNTRYGHQIGDAVLRVVSTTLSDSVKGLDFVARYGGEEFIVLFPKTTLENGAIVADKMRIAVSEHRKRISGTGETLDPITISCGVAEITPSDDADAVVHRADQALYLAKNSGRNQVKTAHDLDA